MCVSGGGGWAGGVVSTLLLNYTVPQKDKARDKACSYLMQIGPIAREPARVMHVNAARGYRRGTIIQCLHVCEEER